VRPQRFAQEGTERKVNQSLQWQGYHHDHRERQSFESYQFHCLGRGFRQQTPWGSGWRAAWI